LTGLLILSLPVIASLQFYAGYPIRLFTAYIAGKLISLTGHSVIADGTMLLWFGERIAVDAPCAGIRMLWTGLFLSFTLAVVFNFNARETWISYSCASVLLFSGNVLRNCLLFFLEAGIIQLPDGAHSGIGLTVFLLVAIGVILLNQKINTRSMQSNVARTRWATV
jgi:exosortase/archaeosortase family protein